MDRFIKSMKAFPFKGMLVIWGIFMLMGAVLFAERSGIHYEGSKSQSAYLSENQIVTEKEAVKEFGSRIAVGIDARNGMVATEGWLESSSVHYLELAMEMEQAGVENINYKDISRDGTLEGVNLEQLEHLNHTVSCNIIASGGVRSLEDIKACQDLGLYGCICGKALYSGNLDLKEAIEKAGG